MHDSGPKRRGALDSKGVTHRPAIGISHPYGNGVLFVEANGPGISKAAAGACLGGYSFAEGQGRIEAEALFAGFIVTQNIGHDFCRRRRGDSGDWKKFGGQQFWPGCQSTASQTGIRYREVGESNFGVAQDESGTVVIESAGKNEAPLLQFEEGRTGADSTERNNCRNIKGTGECFPNAYWAEITMVEILRIVIAIFVANCVGSIGQQCRRRQQSAIDGREIDKWFKSRTAAPRS